MKINYGKLFILILSITLILIFIYYLYTNTSEHFAVDINNRVQAIVNNSGLSTKQIRFLDININNKQNPVGTGGILSSKNGNRNPNINNWGYIIIGPNTTVDLFTGSNKSGNCNYIRNNSNGAIVQKLQETYYNSYTIRDTNGPGPNKCKLLN